MAIAIPAAANKPSKMVRMNTSLEFICITFEVKRRSALREKESPNNRWNNPLRAFCYDSEITGSLQLREHEEKVERRLSTP